jgi:uncharacterized protein
VGRTVTPRFVDVDGGPDGRRFVLLHEPAAAPRGWVVYVHPWAEEMNKARRMAAGQARRLADDGWAVLQIDLLGCGDSAGDFGDASWARWVADVRAACALVPAGAALWLWGLRAGCLLATEAAAGLGRACRLLLWQPQTNGSQVLQQFLRLKAAGEMLAGGGKGVVEGLRAELRAGRAVEVAGYTVAPALAAGLEQARLVPPPGCLQVEWLEVASRADATWSPASTLAHQAWRAAGVPLRAQLVAGPAFWQTTEIEDAPALWQATAHALAAPANAAADTRVAA